MNALLGDTFSRENNTHGSRFHVRDPQFASRILGAMTQSCYIGTRDIRSRVIRGPYCITNILPWRVSQTVYHNMNYIMTECIVTPLEIMVTPWTLIHGRQF